MEGNDDYDPLLGDFDDAAQADASEKPAPEDAAPSAKVIRNAELADNLRNNAAAGWIFLVTNSTLGEQIGPDAFLVFRNLMVKEAGDPTDPIERMLIEQIALAHFSIGQLRIRSCSTEIGKLAMGYADSATRLLAEFRRCTLGLEEYRAKRASRIEKRGTAEVAADQASPKPNGHVKPSANGKEKRRHTELADNKNGEMPEWLKQRMSYPTPNGSPLAAATAGNGKA